MAQQAENQIRHGIDLAGQEHGRTGRPVDMLIDLTESEESKGTDELVMVIQYFAAQCPPLSGRIAVVAPEDLLYGLSRVFSAHGADWGLQASVFRDQAAASEWIEG